MLVHAPDGEHQTPEAYNIIRQEVINMNSDQHCFYHAVLDQVRNRPEVSQLITTTAFTTRYLTRYATDVR